MNLITINSFNRFWLFAVHEFSKRLETFVSYCVVVTDDFIGRINPYICNSSSKQRKKTSQDVKTTHVQASRQNINFRHDR